MECCDGYCRPSELRAAAIVSCSSPGEYHNVYLRCHRLISTCSAPARLYCDYAITTQPRRSLDRAPGVVTRTVDRTFVSLSRREMQSSTTHVSNTSTVGASHLVPGDVLDSLPTGENARQVDIDLESMSSTAHDLPHMPHLQSMTKLRAFLSDATDVPRAYTARDIRHRYLLWRSQGVLHNLSSTDISSLIRLLGTLSLSTSNELYSSIHSHPRVSHMSRSAYAPHWDLLTTMYRDKRYSLRYPLPPSDRYWMMRAYLAMFLERGSSG